MNRTHFGAVVALGLAIAFAACTSGPAHPSDINTDLNVGARGEAHPLSASTVQSKKTPSASAQKAVGSSTEVAAVRSSK